jgi:hypothetical protein
MGFILYLQGLLLSLLLLLFYLILIFVLNSYCFVAEINVETECAIGSSEKSFCLLRRVDVGLLILKVKRRCPPSTCLRGNLLIVFAPHCRVAPRISNAG